MPSAASSAPVGGARIAILLGAWICTAAVPVRSAAQSLETETARVLKRGTVEIGHNFEFQTSTDGTELALPFAVEWGITNRLEFMVEPVAYTAIRPRSGSRATGAGDIEMTMTYLVAGETASRPAIGVAGEVKVPTARNSLIGTGKTDYAVYLVGSRRLGRVDAHAHLSYTFVGQPAGAHLRNILGAALAVEVPLSSRNEFFAEALANTAASANAEPAATMPGGSGVPPEAAAGEVVGTVGVARWVTTFLKLSGSVSVDNNGAVLFRPGFQFKFH
jgi:hypothetical protein